MISVPIYLPESISSSSEALTPREIAEHAMTIASEICIYTNANLTIEEL